MKKLISALALSLTFSLAFAQLEKEITDLFEEVKNRPGAIIGVYEDGEIEFQKAYGLANLDYDIPITSKTVFDVGSVAKQFTAACIHILVKKGLLDLDESLKDIEGDNQKQQDEIISDTKSNEITKTDDETQQALDSVKNAVSQSMNMNEDEINNTLEENSELSNEVPEIINKDLEDFKNILSSLPNLAEEAIYKVFENKILEISYELAGYQIDKMPEKYEKKIKSFLKNINCFEDKITVEVNDQDFEALSKIKDFNKKEEKKVFISNKELSRGDIILNCDGMRYSEKSVYIT